MSDVLQCISEACSSARASADLAKAYSDSAKKALEDSNYKGKWANGSYSLGDAVSHNGVIYKSDEDNNTDEPPSSKWTATTSEVPLDPATFGAKCDGVNDDSTALATALSTGLSVDGGNRVYKIDNKIKLYTDTILSNAILDCTNIDPNDFNAQEGVIEVRGSVEVDIATITEQAELETTKLKLNDTSVVNVGDIVQIKAQGKWDISDNVSNTYITRIIKVDTDYIHIERKTPFVIETNSTIDRVNKVKLYLDNVKVIGNVADKNIGAIRGFSVDVKLRDIEITKFGYCGVEIADSYNINTYNTTFIDANYDGLSYGLVLSNTSSANIKKVRGGDVRHLITVGGRAGVSIDITIEDVIGNTREATIDSHSACDNMTILNSDLKHDLGDDDSCIVFQGRNLTVNNTIIDSSVNIAFLMQGLTKRENKLLLSNSNIISNASIALDIECRNNTDIVISNCFIKSTQREGLLIKNFTDNNNITGAIENCKIESADKGIFVVNNCNFYVNIKDNNIQGSNYGVYLQGNSNTEKVVGCTLLNNNIVSDDIGIRYYNTENARDMFNKITANTERIKNSDSTNIQVLQETWTEL